MTFYYERFIPMFISVDPLADKYPGWGGYVYALNNPLIYWDPTGEAAYYTKRGKPLNDNGAKDNLKFVVTNRKDRKRIKKAKPETLTNFEQGTIPVMSKSTAAKMDEAQKNTFKDGRERAIVQDKKGNSSNIQIGPENGKNVNIGPAYDEIGGVKNASMESHTHGAFTKNEEKAKLTPSTPEDGSAGGDVKNFTGIPSTIVGTDWQTKIVNETAEDPLTGEPIKSDTKIEVPDPVSAIISYDANGAILGQMNWEDYLEAIGNIE